jgi:hypothetical protein
VVIEGVCVHCGGVTFHDATGIDENAIAEVPTTIQRAVTGRPGPLHFARASKRNRTKVNDRFRVIWAASLTDRYWPMSPRFAFQ